VDSSGEISDSKLFPEDVCDSEYIRSTSKSETSDYLSEDGFPLPTSILKENQNQEGKQQPRKRHNIEKSSTGSRADDDSTSCTGRANNLYYKVKSYWR
jgi:maleate cis-trans isomerase